MKNDLFSFFFVLGKLVLEFARQKDKRIVTFENECAVRPNTIFVGSFHERTSVSFI